MAMGMSGLIRTAIMSTVKGRQYRASTKEEGLDQAKAFADNWYLGLRGKSVAGLLKTETTFEQAAKKFEQEYAVITQGERSPKWVEGHSFRLRLHLVLFFGKMGLSEISAGTVQDHRLHRATTSKNGKLPARSTLHDEVGTLRKDTRTGVDANPLAGSPNTPLRGVHWGSAPCPVTELQHGGRIPTYRPLIDLMAIPPQAGG